MDQISFYIIMTAVITLLFTVLLGGLILIFTLLAKQMRLKKNPIDIDIYEFNKTGCILRREIGRIHFHEDYGNCLVTAGKGKKIKEFLGNTFSDNEIVPVKSTNWLNKGRRYISVAVKDGIYASLEMIEKEDKDKLTKEQFQILQSYVTQVKIESNPTYFALNPIKAEQTRFVLDINKELQENYLNDENMEFAKKLMKNAITVFIFGIFIVLIMFIVLVSQGGNLVASLPKPPLPPG